MAKINLIAQNFDIYEGDGSDKYARTGDTSIDHIERAGAEGIILGHSEVGDSPQILNKKLLTLKKFKESNPESLKKLVILIGESWQDFKNNSPENIAKLMVEKCKVIFDGVSKVFLNNLIVGYEPQWGSKGSGRDDVPPPEPEFISECIKNMKQFFKDKHGIEKGIYYIYGGRSTPERTKEILSDKNVDGLILGSACNTVEKTLAIVRVMRETSTNEKKVLVCNFKAYQLKDSYEKYVKELSKLSEDFIVYLAPCYTDLRYVNRIIK